MGKEASKYLEKKFCEKFSVVYKEMEGEIEKSLNETITKLDKEFLKLSSKKNLLCGSTILVCIIKGSQIYFANVGDSRAIGLK